MGLTIRGVKSKNSFAWLCCDVYKHVDSMTCEAVIVEKVGMFEEDDSFALWYLADVNLIEFHKVD